LDPADLPALQKAVKGRILARVGWTIVRAVAMILLWRRQVAKVRTFEEHHLRAQVRERRAITLSVGQRKGREAKGRGAK
jgi:hypothetical protein